MSLAYWGSKPMSLCKYVLQMKLNFEGLEWLAVYCVSMSCRLPRLVHTLHRKTFFLIDFLNVEEVSLR